MTTNVKPHVNQSLGGAISPNVRLALSRKQFDNSKVIPLAESMAGEVMMSQPCSPRENRKNEAKGEKRYHLTHMGGLFHQSSSDRGMIKCCTLDRVRNAVRYVLSLSIIYIS